MDILHIITQMLMIFGIVLVGLFAAKRKLWSGDLDRKLSVFIMNISMPALILASAMGKDLDFENSDLISLIVVAIVNYILLVLLACFLPRFFRINMTRRGIYRFMLAFGSASFVGYPVCDAVFGIKAVFYASVLNIPYNLLLFTIGASFINGGKTKSAFSPKYVFSPSVIASLIAVLIVVLRVHVPQPVVDWFHLLGDLTMPCAQLIIGSSLSHLTLREMLGNRIVYSAALLRLVVQPLFIGVILALLGVDAFVCDVAVVLTATPVAANGIMMCLQYKKDERLMTQGLFVTTLLSVLTIPFVAYVANMF